jgi:DNA-binding transcriptional MerR regulator
VLYFSRLFPEMADNSTPIAIPKRSLFKGVEVCELVKVQPYVLRSWEAEFPKLGITKSPGGPRVYRRADVEQVVRIKHLLLVEGLTLAGARRRLEEESTPVAPDAAVIDELIGENARERLTEVKRGLQSLLDLLSGRGGGSEFRLEPLPARSPALRATTGSGAKAARTKAAGSRHAGASRRKRA